MANVLTCDSLQLSAKGGNGTTVWSVSPTTGAGSVSANGDYTAPGVAPSDPAVTVTASQGSSKATAALEVATGFPGSPVLVPIGANDNAGSNVPVERTFTANGKAMYAAILGPVGVSGAITEADIFASTNGGQSFTGPTSFSTGNLSCVSAVPDVGDPSVVYLVYLAGHGDSTSNTGTTMRLAVSTDGAKTFPTQFVLADDSNTLPDLICPDLVSPSANHVIVTAIAGEWVEGQSVWAGTWVSGNRGADIGPPLEADGGFAGFVDGGELSALSTSDTNSATAQGCNIASNGNNAGPRIAANGAGDVCIVYEFEGPCAPYTSTTDGEIFAQCSSNNGQTWASPLAVAGPSSGAHNHPTIAVSPAGNVAVTWLDAVTVDGGATIPQTFLAISKNLGESFGAAFTYPQPADLQGTTQNPNVAWENDQVLWLTETVTTTTAPAIVVDKTCDYGVTWSGAVANGAGFSTSSFFDYTSSSLVLGSGGMTVGGYGLGSGPDAGASNLVVISLSRP